MPFTLEVEFTGLCMFVINTRVRAGVDVDDVVVLLPECRRKEKDPIHLDNTPARAHTGYLRFDLGNLDIEKNPFATGSPTYGPFYEGVHRFSRQLLDFGLSDMEWEAVEPMLPEVHRFAPTLRLRREVIAANPSGTRAVMRTQLRGGTLRGKVDKGEKDEWQFPKTFNPAEAYRGEFVDHVVWRRRVEREDEDVLNLTIKPMSGGGSEPETLVRLRPRDDGIIRLKIANLCCANPLEWDSLENECPEPLRRRPAKEVENEKKPRATVDVDFKWFYQLLLPAGKPNYDELLKRGNLPIPKLLTEDRGGQGCVGLTVYNPPR
jgi:hypothetical protein